MKLFKLYFNLKLHYKILISIVVGIFLGIFLPQFSVYLHPVSILFIRLLKMIMIPLVLAALITGIANLKNVDQITKVGLKTGLYFLSTSLIAITIGIIVAILLKPGSSKLVKQASYSPYINNSEHPFLLIRFIEDIVPDNIFLSFVEGNILAIILISVLIGLSLLSIGKEGHPLNDAVNSFYKVIIRLTEWIIQTAPLGVLALMAEMIAKLGITAIKSLAFYMICVIIGLLIQFFIISPLLLKAISKYSPVLLFKHMFLALTTVFSTASSSATLPVTMSCLKKNVKVSNRVTSFVASLGTTLNMDGTAIYQVISVVFLAQFYNIELTFSQLLLITITTIFASMGTAGIPSSGLFTLVIILNSVNVPLEGIGMIMAVDRVLDMCRSTVNIWGDSCSAVIIASIEGENFE